MKFILTIWLTLFWAGTSLSQNAGWKSRWVPAGVTLHQLDSLSVIPGSVQVLRGDSCTWSFTAENNSITVFLSGDKPDSVQVLYRTFPVDWHKRYFARSLSEYDSSVISYSGPVVLSPVKEINKEELIEVAEINKSGALTRGVSFGNHQDIFVNSVFNLNMEGKVSDHMNIRASINDQQVPFQPEGNTVLVSDFDNIYMELYNDRLSLRGGDLIINSRDSYFSRYQRNTLGLSLNTRYTVKQTGQAETSLSLSMAKGKAATYTILPADGVMGPYRIYGPGKDKYILILSNSEKVYLDGQLLRRGYNLDYVVDYNTAEITFSETVLITRYSRIIVEFQYFNQYYRKSVTAVQHRQSLGRLEVGFNYFSEKDNPDRSPGNQMTTAQPLMLSSHGDQEYFGTLPGMDSSEYIRGDIRYKKTDTLDLNGNQVSVYVFSQDPDSAWYKVYFSEVGNNQGDYMKVTDPTMGIYYRWISPVDGQSQGSFDPVRIIPLPSSLQLIEFNSRLNLNSHESIFSDLAFSSSNQNLLIRPSSDLPGLAGRVGVGSRSRGIGKQGNLLYDGSAVLEMNSKNFAEADRYRNVEFDRDWDYDPSSDSIPASDLVAVARNGFRLKKSRLSHEIGYRNKPGVMSGIQNRVLSNIQVHRFHLEGNVFFADNFIWNKNSKWSRYQVQASYNLKQFVPGYRFTSEKNAVTDTTDNRLAGSAIYYQENLFFISGSDTAKTQYRLEYSIRKDKIPEQGEWQDDFLAKTLGMKFEKKLHRSGNAHLHLYYRETETLRNGDPDENSLNGRFNWTQSFLSNHIRSDLFYGMGSGRELKREYVYIPVAGGEGTHTWRDDNQNGMKEPGEFYPAVNPDEKNYIKLFTPTDEYITAYNNSLNVRLNADMPRKWREGTGVYRFMSNFSDQFSLSANYKKDEFSLMDNLFQTKGNDEHLISSRARLRNVVAFNRSGNGYGFDLVMDQHLLKNLYVQGYEARQSRQINLNQRMNFAGQYLLQVFITRGNNGNRSDYLTNRNYNLALNSVSTDLSWQPVNFYRISAVLTHTRKSGNEIQADQENFSGINEAALNFLLSKANRGNLNLNLRFISIDFEGTENSPLGYELLNGLKPGENFTWSFHWQQKLINGLQLSMGYEGRKSGNLEMVHTGRMQITAYF